MFFKHKKITTLIASGTLLAVGLSLPLADNPPSPSDRNNIAAETTTDFSNEKTIYHTVTVLSLDEEEYTYTYTKKKKPSCTLIKKGKNKGKQRCCKVIKKGKNKGKKRCKIRKAPNTISNPVIDPALPDPTPPVPPADEPVYSTDPSSLEFEGPLTGSPNEYAFLTLGTNGTPARWNKCEPIRYKINPNGLTPSALDDVNEAIRRLSLASQIRFEYVGNTNILPYISNNWYDNLPAEEKNSAELWIAFSDESKVGSLSGSTIGIGGPIWEEIYDGRTDARIIAGGITFDTVPNLEPGFGTGAKRGSLIMHELGHVMNLGHVGDPVQIMFPNLYEGTKSMFENGDLAGLRQLHSYPCF